MTNVVKFPITRAIAEGQIGPSTSFNPKLHILSPPHAAACGGSQEVYAPADHSQRLKNTAESILRDQELTETDCRVFLYLLRNLDSAMSSLLVRRFLA